MTLMMTEITMVESFETDRWDAAYWYPEYRVLDKVLKKLHARPLGEFIESITYGQVGKRVLNPKGKVRYLQVINIRAAGIDFLIKPDSLTIGSYNDVPRSRVQSADILFTNTAFGGTQTLLGRCVAVHRDYGMVNVSQDIDVIRVKEIDPYYAAAFVKTPNYGQKQVQRLKYGVRSNKLSFSQVKAIQIPLLDGSVQSGVRNQYLVMAEAHDRAMERKEVLHERHGIAGDDLDELAKGDKSFCANTQEARQRHDHLLATLERVLSGEAKKLAPFRS